MSSHAVARAHPRTVRTLLRRERWAEPFAAAKYRFSPTMACEHGCRYCDGRAERYWVEGEFDRDVVVRVNAPERLVVELPRLRERGVVSIGSGITDPYQPLAVRDGLMRRCAEVLAEHDLPVGLLTKSARVLDDLEVWRRVHRRSGFLLAVSLASLDEELRARYEPGASPVAERLAVLEAFRAAGLPVGVLAMPLLPGLSDGAEALAALLDRLRAVPVDFVVAGGLTLRPGRQKAAFRSTLDAHRPDLRSLYDDLYAEERPSGAPRADYRRALERRCGAALREAGIPALLPHALYRGRLMLYDEVHVLLCHLAQIFAARGVDPRPLVAGHRRLLEWLTPRKAEIDRRRSRSHTALEQALRALCASPDLPALLDNERLAAFLRSVVLERRVFDYVAARLA